MQPDVPEEQRIITLQKGERPRHYLFSVTPIRGRERNLSGIVLLLRDVTRLKEVERLKSEFVMAASHELRTPLTGMGMSIDLLLEHAGQGLAEKDRELLKAAHEEVHRMKALVNDLLDLSKIEAGRIELEFEKVPVQTLFEHVQEVFKGQAEMKQVKLTIGTGRRPARGSRGRQQSHLGADQSGFQRPEIREPGRSDPNHGQKDRPPCPPVRARRRTGYSPGISIEDLSEVRSGEGATVRRHRFRARHLQGDRARSWRRDLGGIIARSGEHLHLHPAGGPIGGTHGKEGDSRCG